jgi:hypothetical protein
VISAIYVLFDTEMRECAMPDLAATSESFRQSRRSSLERLANSASRQVSLFGAAALAIFNAGQPAAHQNIPGRASPVMAVNPAPFVPVAARHSGGRLLSRPAVELRP